MGSNVFISYKAEEYSEAKWVKERLEAAGIRCWMAPESIPGGSNYALQIPRAIRECAAFVMVLSRSAQNSLWVPRELDQAINEGKVVLPYCIDNSPLRDDFNFYLANVQRYEAWRDREGEMRAMIRDILAIIGREDPVSAHPSSPSSSSASSPPSSPASSSSSSPASSQQDRQYFVWIAVTACIAVILLCVLVYLCMGGLKESGSGEDDKAQTAGAVTASDNPGKEESEENIGEESDDPGKEESNVNTGAASIEPGKEESEEDIGEESDIAQTVQSEEVVKEENNVEKEKNQDSGETESVVYNTRGVVRILNKKNDKNLDFEHLAARFEEESGIRVSVETPKAGSYTDTLKSEITGSSSDPTLFMLSGQTDFEKYGSECLELTDTAAAQELEDEFYTLRGSNGKVYGLACIVEAYGLAVNTRLLEKAGYDVSEIQSFADLKRVAQEITARRDELGFSAFTSPSVGIGVSGDYRLAEHASAVPLFYELKDNDFNVGIALRGTYMSNFREFIDLYLDNATVPRSQAASRSLDDAREEFLRGEAVFLQDGSWDTDKLTSVLDYEGAVIPMYMGMPGEEKQGLNETVSYFWCVNKYASGDDIEATLQFLHWLVTSKAGIRIMTEDMGFQIPYKKAEVPDDPFLKTLHEEKKQELMPISQYYKSGKYISWINSLKNAIKDYADHSGNWKAVEEAFIGLW